MSFIWSSYLDQFPPVSLSPTSSLALKPKDAHPAKFIFCFFVINSPLRWLFYVGSPWMLSPSRLNLCLTVFSCITPNIHCPFAIDIDIPWQNATLLKSINRSGTKWLPWGTPLQTIRQLEQFFNAGDQHILRVLKSYFPMNI